MARPKPVEPLTQRCIGMTSAHWAAFDQLGGREWLRSRLTKLRLSGIATRERNTRLRRAYAAGGTCEQLAATFKLDRTTVWRIVS